MQQLKNGISKVPKLAASALLFVAFLAGSSARSLSPQDKMKPETITAVTTGSGTQSGQMTSVMVTINEFSTEEDRQILVDAFNKAQNTGLTNALSKMKAVGRISITGTLGMDITYIRLIPTPTGRQIRFVTNRTIAHGKALPDEHSPQSFTLTGGVFDLNDSDRKKSKGVLYPAARLVIDKEGQLQIQLNQEVWNLADIIDKK